MFYVMLCNVMFILVFRLKPNYAKCGRNSMELGECKLLFYNSSSLYLRVFPTLLGLSLLFIL